MDPISGLEPSAPFLELGPSYPILVSEAEHYHEVSVNFDSFFSSQGSEPSILHRDPHPEASEGWTPSRNLRMYFIPPTMPALAQAPPFLDEGLGLSFMGFSHPRDRHTPL